MHGNIFKKARLESGLTQEALAAKAKLHRTYISLIERDKKTPTLDVLFRICKVLKIKPSELVKRMEK